MVTTVSFGLFAGGKMNPNETTVFDFVEKLNMRSFKNYGDKYIKLL